MALAESGHLGKPSGAASLQVGVEMMSGLGSGSNNNGPSPIHASGHGASLGNPMRTKSARNVHASPAAALHAAHQNANQQTANANAAMRGSHSVAQSRNSRSQGSVAVRYVGDLG